MEIGYGLLVLFLLNSILLFGAIARIKEFNRRAKKIDEHLSKLILRRKR